MTETVLFRGVCEDWIRSWLLQSNVKVCEFETGDYLFRKNDSFDRLGILLRGAADVSRVSQDGLMHMSTLKRNDLFGAASLFCSDTSYVTDIRCIEKARVMMIREEDMLNLLSQNKTVLRNYLSYLNCRIRFLNKRLDAFSKSNVAARIMTFFASEASNGVYRVKSLTKLSESLCISRATLYRTLDTLEDNNKIRRNGKEIILLEEYEP